MDSKLNRDFLIKFNELSEENQKYIIAIQQALIFAQTSSEKGSTQRKTEKEPA